MSDRRLNLALIAALVALLGLVGRMDYIASRQLECASYIKPHEYDEALDACVPLVKAANTPPTDQEYYHAAPKASHPIRH